MLQVPTMHSDLEAHGERTAMTAVQIGEHLGMNRQDLRRLWLGAHLHDVGKLDVPDEILDLPRALSDSERFVVERHPVLGHSILEGSVHAEVAAAVLSHHERIDGLGYPFGLAGEEIPRMARVVAVADAIDVMVTERSYKPAYSVEYAISELNAHRGTQFDAEVVDAALFVLGADRSVAQLVLAV